MIGHFFVFYFCMLCFIAFVPGCSNEDLPTIPEETIEVPKEEEIEKPQVEEISIPDPQNEIPRQPPRPRILTEVEAPTLPPLQETLLINPEEMNPNEVIESESLEDDIESLERMNLPESPPQAISEDADMDVFTCPVGYRILLVGNRPGCVPICQYAALLGGYERWTYWSEGQSALRGGDKEIRTCHELNDIDTSWWWGSKGEGWEGVRTWREFDYYDPLDGLHHSSYRVWEEMIHKDNEVHGVCCVTGMPVDLSKIKGG